MLANGVEDVWIDLIVRPDDTIRRGQLIARLRIRYGTIPVAFFFFSSRRRHTRCLSDWSSDVCSSDLRTTVQTRYDPRWRRCPCHVVLRITKRLSWLTRNEIGWLASIGSPGAAGTRINSDRKSVV